MAKFPDPSCVLKVGDGRGFIYERRISTKDWRPQKGEEPRLRPFVKRRLVVVTAAHCLPLGCDRCDATKLPPSHPAASSHERTYPRLLGSLDGKKTEVAAECLSVDPVADIAVLGRPDQQELYEEAGAYDDLVDNATALHIAPAQSGPGWMLSLDGRWMPITLEVTATIYGASLEIDPTEPGQSGSPILNHTGQAIGLISCGSETSSLANGKRTNERAGQQPILTLDLPGRFVGNLGVGSR